MAIKFERVQAGDRLYRKMRVGVGNTTMRADSVYDAKIISIDHEAGTAVVSWNGNRPEKWSRRQVERLYRNPPKTTGRW